MSALQRRPATRVAPVVFVVQIAVPVVLAPLVTGESWSSTPLGGVALVGFLTLVLAGAAALGRTAAVSGLVAAGADQLGDGFGTEPAAERRRSSSRWWRATWPRGRRRRFGPPLRDEEPDRLARAGLGGALHR